MACAKAPSPASLPFTMPPTDPRVRDIVDSLLDAEGVRWQAYLRPCPKGAKHMVQHSYGAKVWEHVGHLYELCLADSRARCARDTQPLNQQMANATRLTMLKRLHGLQPAPYGIPVYWGQALLMHGLLEKEIEQDARRDTRLSARANAPRALTSWSSTGSLSSAFSQASAMSSPATFGNTTASGTVAAPARSDHSVIRSDSKGSERGRSASSVITHRSGAGSSRSSHGSVSSSRSERGTVGRPVNPNTCEVVVYVYAPAEQKPRTINAVGTPRGNVVEFVFGQAKIKDALGLHTGAGPKQTYLFYNRTIGGWALYRDRVIRLGLCVVTVGGRITRCCEPAHAARRQR
ncbi:hypothetical protein OH77DRAFT_546979, partial [Trametes cingulata]